VRSKMLLRIISVNVGFCERLQLSTIHRWHPSVGWLLNIHTKTQLASVLAFRHMNFSALLSHIVHGLDIPHFTFNISKNTGMSFAEQTAGMYFARSVFWFFAPRTMLYASK